MTFELVVYAFVVSLVFTVPVALIAARKPHGVADRLSMVVSMAGLSTAPYVLALLLILVFAVHLQVLPAIGYVPPGQSFGGTSGRSRCRPSRSGSRCSASTPGCCARTWWSRCRPRTTS